MEINYQNTQNFPPTSVLNTLQNTQQPLGTQFPSYELNGAINHYLLDPFQYSITKFNYTLPDGKISNSNQVDTNFYKDVNFNTILPSFTAEKKSVNDFPAQDYHRFLANEGYFNPQEGTNNKDLWYYGADRPSQPSGPALNVQEVNHIIFPEAQRGGLNSSNLAKYSWVNTQEPKQMVSWEAANTDAINNDSRCEFFNYNNTYSDKFNGRPVNEVYSFDSNYCRSIGINSPTSGSMPFVN
jgi:hypothetical protein